MRSFKVKQFDLVDKTRYMEGDVFLTETEIGILHNAQIEPMVKQSDLKEYVKRKDVVKMIDTALKKVKLDG